ncbi:MAG: amidohydrolase [Sphingomonadales bacterium]|nr:amidohydrolase [Sphingomonadales bacterium]MBM3924066.1 amidohydrolase [Sphingomonadales bacterium]
MASKIEALRRDAETMQAALISDRRHLHQHPELSFEERETSQFVMRRLQDLDIPYREGVGGYGVLANIAGVGTGPTVALRADMDALPIQEANNVPYASKVAGVMHACGHDVHTASLLGAAALLRSRTGEFRGNVRLLFQPAEERLPGGASLMIRDGALQDPVPVSIYGQHVMPLLDSGKVGFRSGQYMASADEIRLTIRGKGGHAAMPHLNTDSVLTASHVVVALQQVVSRRANPTLPSVLSFGHIIGEGAYNVLPNEVKLRGTFRTLDEGWREQAHRFIREIAEGTASAMGATCLVEIDKGYPMLYNHPRPTSLARRTAEQYLGSENVVDLDLWMAAEDFAWYAQEIPASFYRLGTRNEAKGIVSSVHTPTFDIEEDAMATGAGLLAAIALEQLAEALTRN